MVKRKGNPKESTLEAWGLVDGQPTSAHFGLRVYDDVVAPESVTTPEQINKTTEAWELSDNLGTIGGRKWHVGTRYHFGDEVVGGATAFEEREPVGVEKAAAVGGQGETVVVDATVHGSEGGKETVPGGRAPSSGGETTKTNWRRSRAESR